MKRSFWIVWLVVLAGITAVSSASLFIKMAAAPALTVAAYRVTIATLVLLLFRILHKSSKARVNKSTLLAITGSGFCLAAHFACWITSLDYTSVAVSVSLVNTSPIFVVLMSAVFLRERPGIMFWMGLLAAIIGSTFLVHYDDPNGNGNTFGAFLALLGALALAGYLLIGRYALKSVSFHSYVLLVYGTASVLLLALCTLLGTPLRGFSRETYLFLLLIGLIPQLIGHSAFNWALQHLPAFLVSVLILGEPIGATLLAYIFLDEKVAPGQALGLGVLCLGLVTCSIATSIHSVDSKIQSQ